jgi:hypothetical protein
MSEMAAEGPHEVRARNRRLLGVLLAIVAALVASAFAIGIRW